MNSVMDNHFGPEEDKWEGGRLCFVFFLILLHYTWSNFMELLANALVDINIPFSLLNGNVST